MNLESKIDEFLEDFIQKVKGAVEEEYGEAPLDELLWFGTYQKGGGSRLEIADKFSVDLSYNHLWIDDEEDLDEEE